MNEGVLWGRGVRRGKERQVGGCHDDDIILSGPGSSTQSHQNTKCSLLHRPGHNHTGRAPHTGFVLPAPAPPRPLVVFIGGNHFTSQVLKQFSVTTALFGRRGGPAGFCRVLRFPAGPAVPWGMCRPCGSSGPGPPSLPRCAHCLCPVPPETHCLLLAREAFGFHAELFHVRATYLRAFM